MMPEEISMEEEETIIMLKTKSGISGLGASIIVQVYNQEIAFMNVNTEGLQKCANHWQPSRKVRPD